MQYTENLNLNKPGPSDQYNIQHFNDNFDTIDSHIHGLEEASTSVELEITEKVEEAKQFPNMNGVCPVNKGGTGANNAQTALNNLHSGIEVVSDIPANGEVTFINRTPADVELGTPEVYDVKGITLDKLAAKVYELIRADTGLFTQAKNGLVPKTGAGQGVRFLSSEGVWRTPDGASTVYEATASSSWAVNGDTILRIRADCTSVVGDATVYGTKLTVVNETENYQQASLRKAGGTEIVTFRPGGSVVFIWTGYWNPEVGVDTVVDGNSPIAVSSKAVAEYTSQSVTAGDPRPVSGGAVSTAIAGVNLPVAYYSGSFSTPVVLPLAEIQARKLVFLHKLENASGSFYVFSRTLGVISTGNFMWFAANSGVFGFRDIDNVDKDWLRFSNYTGNTTTVTCVDGYWNLWAI